MEGTKMYVYREGTYEDAMGNEIVRIFSDKEKALWYMRRKVEKDFQCEFDELEKLYQHNRDAFIYPDYVEIPTGRDIYFYIVEETAVDAA